MRTSVASWRRTTRRPRRETGDDALYVAGLWRYPVETLAGERLPAATLTADGVQGDRLVQVYGPEGVRTSRRHRRGPATARSWRKPAFFKVRDDPFENRECGWEAGSLLSRSDVVLAAAPFRIKVYRVKPLALP